MALGDPGDDTGRRFRYQYTYAAVLACGSLDDTTSIEEVFCEHHEDILVKRKSGRYLGVQVKTRDAGGELWKTFDEDILGALAKFVRNDASFPGQFEGFTLATNHQFFTVRDNGNNLPYVLGLARSTTLPPSRGPLAKLVRKLASLTARTRLEILATLQRTQADHDLPKFHDCERNLCGALSSAHPP